MSRDATIAKGRVLVPLRLRRGSRSAARGVTLVEFAVAALGLAFLGLLATSMLRGLEAVGARQQSANSLAKVEDAILGFVLVNHRLPQPTNASSAQPGYLDGELPAAELGISGGIPTLMRVSAAATGAALPVFNPDPDGATGGLIGVGSNANGLDLCARLIQQMQSAAAAGSSSPEVAYAIVQIAARTPDLGEGLGAEVKPRDGAVTLDRRLRGIPEVIDRLGCFHALESVVSASREAAVLRDAVQLAAVMQSARELNARKATWSVANQIWRGTNRELLLAQGASNIAFQIATADYSHIGKIQLGISLAGIAASLTGTIDVIARASLALPVAMEAEQKARRDVRRHSEYVKDLQTRAADAAADANTLQAKGLLP